MGPSNSSFLPFRVVCDFHDYGRKGNLPFFYNATSGCSFFPKSRNFEDYQNTATRLVLLQRPVGSVNGTGVSQEEIRPCDFKDSGVLKRSPLRIGKCMKIPGDLDCYPKYHRVVILKYPTLSHLEC